MLPKDALASNESPRNVLTDWLPANWAADPEKLCVTVVSTVRSSRASSASRVGRFRAGGVAFRFFKGRRALVRGLTNRRCNQEGIVMPKSLHLPRGRVV